MYIFTVAKFDELIDVMQGTALRLLQHVKEAGKEAAFEEYAQAYLDGICGADYEVFSRWLARDAARIMVALDIPV